MRLPSLQYISRRSLKTLQRFPLPLFFAAVATAAAIYLAEQSFEGRDQIQKGLLVAILGIPLFIATQLLSEIRGWGRNFSITIHAALTGILLLYYFWLPHTLNPAPDYHFYRYALYILAVHLLVAVGPYFGKDSMITFWQYNKTLFLRFLTAIFFTGVLNVGLSVALLSIDALLGVNIEAIRYFQLFAFLAFIFNTWFFLSGIPASFGTFSIGDDYPKGLKIFTQNVLIPLVVIYLTILYLYAGKILVQWDWPEGWVSNLIISFSIVGILAILLLYPIQGQSENRWIKRFTKGYFWSLIPLVMLLLLAIYRRISEYGITVERYFILALGLWLAGIVFYFVLSRVKNIKIIPASLSLVSVLISFGPWGAFSVSEQSQISRLTHFLQQNELLQENAVQTASTPVAFQDRQEISSIVQYLVETHGIQGIALWFEQDITNVPTESGETRTPNEQPTHLEQARYIVSLMGIEYVNPNRSVNPQQKQLLSDNQQAASVEGYDWIVQQVLIPANGDHQQININGQELIIEPDSRSLNMDIYFAGDSSTRSTIRIESLVEHLKEEYPAQARNLPREQMSITASNNNWKLKAYFRDIHWREEDNGRILESAVLDVLIAFNS